MQKVYAQPPRGRSSSGGHILRDPGRCIVRGLFPLASLARGDYVVRAIVGTPASGEGRVTRALRNMT
jgi:hypothetical protein